MDYDEVEPTCDICNESQSCDNEGCTICPSNWNGETGNHFNCEEENPDMSEFYAQLRVG